MKIAIIGDVHCTGISILPLSIHASDREYPEQGRLVMFDTSTLELYWRHID